MPIYSDIKAQQAAADLNACHGLIESSENVVGLTAGAVLKVAPVSGAIYGAINTAVKVGAALHDGNVGKATSEFVAGAANTAASIFAGGLAGDAATEVVRQGVGVVANEKSMPDKSGLRTLVDDMRCLGAPGAQTETGPAATSASVPTPKQKKIIKQRPSVQGWHTTVTM